MPPRSEFVLGTVCTVNLYRDGSAALYGKIFSRLRELENILSVNIPDSNISKINNAAGRGPEPARAELLEILEMALIIAEQSGGAFDPSIGPLVKLWGIGSSAARIPGPEEIAAALPLVNWRDVVIDREAGTVLLRRPGMALDLGGIAKGYAADELVRILQAEKARRAIIDLGGNIYLFGKKEEGEPWRVGVQDPLDSRGATVGVLELFTPGSVVTSGIYERFFEAGGQRYHHILSAGDGYPARSGLLGVTIIAGSSMEADALSTAVFVLGWEEGVKLLASRRAGGMARGNREGAPEGVFIFDDRSVRCTAGAAGLFTLVNETFRKPGGL